MSDLTRAEMEAFWAEWLDVNREAERSGDWRVMAEMYAQDATYGWMYAPDEHFMAVGRDQIRDWAIGIEMDGLDGWHYDYQCAVMDEQKGMVVGFWKQKSGITDDATGQEYEILGIGHAVLAAGLGTGPAHPNAADDLAEPVRFRETDADQPALVGLPAAGFDADFRNPDNPGQGSLLDRNVLNALGRD